ncbi:MAG: hypothetical protein ACREJC_16845, partial [Tepidisphaeraceae bacterium]
MTALFVVLCTVIGGYWFLTDSRRVREMAEGYLSTITGGQVKIASATLSIFQGLRLNGVRVFVDSRTDDESLLFRAQTFFVRYNPRALLSGRIEATQIVAVDPVVNLVEDVNTGKWNYHRFQRPTSMPVTRWGEFPPELPEVVLRNARVEYSQVVEGHRRAVGVMSLEGQFKPTLEPNVYGFKLQSRGELEVGANVEGHVDMNTRVVTAALRNFRFNTDLQAMLPAQVRAWWARHNLSGRVDVPVLIYKPDPNPGKSAFTAEIDLRGVTLSVQPDEWLSSDEVQRLRWIHAALQGMRAGGLNGGGFVSRLSQVVEPTPITLHKVNGKFIFTEDRLEVQDVYGHVENNGLRISGVIGNYASPDQATATVTVSSMELENIVIPASPRYINSMPAPVREIYDHLRPQGTCSFWVTLMRPTPRARPQVEGEITVLDGSFVFDRFPYPIWGATGKLQFGQDATTGLEKLEIVEIRGHGPDSGPNRAARCRITGTITPFGPETGVKVVVTGENVSSDPLLFAAFPRATRQALKLFDAAGKGEFPRFRGSFQCDVARPRGLNQRWTVDTRIHLDDASGSLAVFPYAMSGVTGDITVHDDRVEVKKARMTREGAELQIDGVVTWKEPQAEAGPRSPGSEDRLPPLRPDLTIQARNVPIDAALLEALPVSQRRWLEKLGVAGRFDLDGTVSTTPIAEPGSTAAPEIDFDFRIALRDGVVAPKGTPTATALAGVMR